MAIAGLLPDTTVGPDGRPLIELHTVIDHGDTVELAGTACMYEGALLVTVDDRRHQTVRLVTATAGGPERGDWTTCIPAPERPARISIGADNPGEGNVLRRTMALVAVS